MPSFSFGSSIFFVDRPMDQVVGKRSGSEDRVGLDTYKHTMLNTMAELKMLAMPRAKQRTMHSTPILLINQVSQLFHS